MHRLTVQYERPDDVEAFRARYVERHVPLCRALPGLVAASFSFPRPLGPATTPFLVAELDFADAATLKAAMRSPEMAAVAEDAAELPAARVMFTGEVIGA